MDICVSKNRIDGSVSAPSSKSLVQRYILLSAVADSETKIAYIGESEDISAAKRCAAALGASITDESGIISVAPSMYPDALPIYDCGDSAAVLRFFLPVAATTGKENRFSGTKALAQRPIQPLVDVLSSCGTHFSSNSIPFVVSGKLKAGSYKIDGGQSSQFTSGLLMAMPLISGESRVTVTGKAVSAPYIDMTIEAMNAFGVSVNREGDTLRTEGRYVSPKSIVAEGDWSGAAFLLAAGALGGRAEVFGLATPSSQGDSKILDVLESFGAEVRLGKSITVMKKNANPFAMDFTDCPDLFPVAAVLAAAAFGDSVLTGIARLSQKESDRVSAICELLTSLGGSVTRNTDDKITVHGLGALSGGKLDGFSDHRIVMAGMLSALICRDKVLISGAEAIKKSYPGFIEDYRKIGGAVYVIIRN